MIHSHILAVADEEGSLRLMDSRKAAAQSLVKGTCTCNPVHVHLYIIYRDGNGWCSISFCFQLNLSSKDIKVENI